MQTLIRRAGKKDAGDVLRLLKDFSRFLRPLGNRTPTQFTRDTFRRDGFGPNRAFETWIAVQKGRTVGVIIGHMGYDTELASRIYHLIELYVLPACRRQGIAEKLMKTSARYALRRGARAMIWTVFGHNRLAVGFYKKLGAEIIPRLGLMRFRSKRLVKVAES